MHLSQLCYERYLSHCTVRQAGFQMQWPSQRISKRFFRHCLNRWLSGLSQTLRTFLADGNVPMDNNYAEQAIRHFTIKRKNFVCIKSSAATKASVIIYNLIETTKANYLNIYEHFNCYWQKHQSTWMTLFYRSWMNYFHVHYTFSKNLPVVLRNLNFHCSNTFILTLHNCVFFFRMVLIIEGVLSHNTSFRPL